MSEMNFMKKMKAIAVLILVLIVSSFAKDPCTDARELLLKSIPNRKQQHVMSLAWFLIAEILWDFS